MSAADLLQKTNNPFGSLFIDLGCNENKKKLKKWGIQTLKALKKSFQSLETAIRRSCPPRRCSTPAAFFRVSSTLVRSKPQAGQFNGSPTRIKPGPAPGTTQTQGRPPHVHRVRCELRFQTVSGDRIILVEAFLGLLRADQDQLVVFFQHHLRIRVDHHAVLPFDRNDAAAGFLPDFKLQQRFVLQTLPQDVAKDVQALREHQDFFGFEQVHDGRGAKRAEGHHQVGAGAVEGVDIAIQGRPADDLDVGAQPAAVDGEIDVQVVIVGGDDDRRGFFDPGFNQGLEVARVALNKMAVPGGDPRFFFHHVEVHLAFFEGLGHSLAHPPAAQDHHRAFGPVLGAMASDYFVVAIELLGRARQNQDGGFPHERLGA